MNDLGGLLCGAVTVGVICGAVPLALGASKNQSQLGALALILCVIGGLVAWLIGAVPTAILFIWLILRASKSAGA